MSFQGAINKSMVALGGLKGIKSLKGNTNRAQSRSQEMKKRAEQSMQQAVQDKKEQRENFIKRREMKKSITLSDSFNGVLKPGQAEPIVVGRKPNYEGINEIERQLRGVKRNG